MVEPGLTTMLEEVELLLHKKLVAPLAVKVAVVPTHNVAEFTATAGKAFTVTVITAVAVLVQVPDVPVTV